MVARESKRRKEEERNDARKEEKERSGAERGRMQWEENKQ